MEDGRPNFKRMRREDVEGERRDAAEEVNSTLVQKEIEFFSSWNTYACTCLGVLCCFALFVRPCLLLSFISLKHVLSSFCISH